MRSLCGEPQLMPSAVRMNTFTSTVALVERLPIYTDHRDQHPLTFVAPASFLMTFRGNSTCNRPSPRCAASSSSQPRIVVLPGMDGTDLLLTKFRKETSTADDSNRVIAVDYPFNKNMTVSELGDFVCDTYLTPLANDDRGYILVNQSFSGHVGFHLSQQCTPGQLRGQVFVNAFASSPAPSALRYIPTSFTDSLFRNQPPPWLVGRIFLGRKPSGMEDVQSAATKVEPFVMSNRLSICLNENNWHVWRRRDLLPAGRTMYLRGDDDFILRKSEAEKIKLARPDVRWVRIPEGPHLLLQKHGKRCGIAVNEFCSRLTDEMSSSG